MPLAPLARIALAAPLLGLAALPVAAQGDPFARAEARAADSQQAIRFVRRYAAGWLAHADPTSGLLPRTTSGDAFWNAQDCAADNFPFLLLTAHVTGDQALIRTTAAIFDTERRLTPRLDSLPDDFVFGTQAHRRREPPIGALIFGASEYAKDGLMPVTEWLGDGPWVQRMTEMVRDIWKHAPVESPVGRIPSNNVEVNGELLQTMSRLYWLTGEAAYEQWCERLAEHHLFHQRLLDEKVVSLRDHGCEILGGLSEAYVIAATEDPALRRRFRPALHAVLDAILEHGVQPDGMMVNGFDPKTGDVVGEGLSDGFGYVYDAFLTVAELDDEPRYEQAVHHVLENLHAYHCQDVPGLRGADGHADAIEGALNLLNRIPVESAFRWVDREMAAVFALQRPDGIVEGWYGDGNSARTALMYAQWKTQGVCPEPWRDDVRCGAESDGAGGLRLVVKSDGAWAGHLRFDRPRHREVLHLPVDYPRINQFPEWFTVDASRWYLVRCQGRQPERVRGAALLRYELTLQKGEEAKITIEPDPIVTPKTARSLRYTHRSAEAARAWQAELREKLLALLKVDAPARSAAAIEPLHEKELSRTAEDGYTLHEIEIQSTAATRIPVLVTVPDAGGRHPAVVCVHGHGGNRRVVHDDPKLYRKFARELARRGYVTIAANVGQHAVREPGQQLMGERLRDLLRCVDYLVQHPAVDPDRIGCAGLSLGGEMCMWLGALDPRVRATVSSGFLTTMDQMEKNHCMCWKFDGLRQLVDYADIYALTAPRALQCQNGWREGPRSFYVPLARRAMAEIRVTYEDLGATNRLELDVHDEGHVIDLPALLAFLDRHLATKTR